MRQLTLFKKSLNRSKETLANFLKKLNAQFIILNLDYLTP